MAISDDVTVIMRSVGERTEDLCLHKIAQELPEGNIHVIRDLPLHESVMKLSELAVDIGRKWTLLIGADYIPRVGFIHDLYEISKTVDDKTQFIKGTIIDKFLMELRGDVGGPMLQRTDLLETYLKILPTIENRATTEASCQKYFYQRGYTAYRGKLWLALHDYEQDYEKVYRSMFVGGRKHSKHREKLLPRWEELSNEDPDYAVAKYAHLAGARHKGKMEADFTKDYGWSESPFADWIKEPITDMDYDTSRFEHLQYLKQVK